MAYGGRIVQLGAWNYGGISRSGFENVMGAGVNIYCLDTVPYRSPKDFVFW